MYQQLEKKEEQKAVRQPQVQRKEQPNKTGLPDNLKDGIQRLSGYDMSDVRVHYNSAKPAQLNAHAYAQGNQIHLGSGQEKHLPHEAWHVVQQKQGRVQPTMKIGGQSVNDNVRLEREADVMGGKALQMKSTKEGILQRKEVIQMATRLVRGVIFNGYGSRLRELLLGIVPSGTNVTVTQTDHVGGSYNVRFTNSRGPAISLATARGWINRLPEPDSSSDDEEASSSSSGEEE